MSPIRRNGIYYVYVPRQSGGSVLRTTETRDAKVWRGMKRMLAEMKDGRRHWALLAAVDKGPLTLGQLYDAYTLNAHDALQASLSASALLPLMNQYVAACVARGLAPRNVENIKRQLRAFFIYAPNQTTVDLNTATVTAWLTSLKTTPGTRRQYLYALTGFTHHLCDIGVLGDYPLTRVKAPKKNVARMTYKDAATDERIVQAAREDVRALFAFIKATGCDLTTALTITRGDIDLARGTARLKGTKTAQRDVHKALIESWAMPYLRAALTKMLPNVQLWATLNRSIAAHQHTAACKAVGVKGYTLKDARHSVAVRMMEAGYTVQEIAEQLGNSAELVARVYSRHIPTMRHKDVTKSITLAQGENS